MFWSNLPSMLRIPSCKHSGSVYPFCTLERGAEHSMGLLYDTVRQEWGEDGAGFCHREYKHQGTLTPGSIELLKCYFCPAKNYITLSILATSSRRQGKNLYCQAHVHLPRPRPVLLCFVPSASLTMHLPISTTLQAKLQPTLVSVPNYSSSRRLSPRGGEYAHVSTGDSSNAYIKQQGLNWICLLIFNSHHLPCWVWWS